MSYDHDDVVGDGIGHDDGIGGEGISACLKIQIDPKLLPPTFGINWFATISSFDHPKVSKGFCFAHLPALLHHVRVDIDRKHPTGLSQFSQTALLK